MLKLHMTHCDGVTSDFPVTTERILQMTDNLWLNDITHASWRQHSRVPLRRIACSQNPSCDELSVREEIL